MKSILFFLSLSVLLLNGTSAMAGYEAPIFIDGCRSMDGRFEITAKLIEKGKTSHGPNKWNYVWKDTKENSAKEFPASGIQGGQVYGQLFIAPDGETFAFWNHITMYWEEKSHMHASGHGGVVKKEAGDEAFRHQDIFKNRLIIYNRDGSIIKKLDLHELLQEEDWKSVLPVFNRVEWMQPLNDINHKNGVRQTYTFSKVSPDYTVIEFLVGDRKAPRPVRVSLVDGSILSTDEKLPEVKTPIQFVDAKEHPKSGGQWGEAFVPSLDPIRESGRYLIQTIEEAFPGENAPKKLDKFELGEIKLLADGFGKADTPTWLENRGKKPEEAARLIFTDLDNDTLYALFPDDQKTVVRAGATRGKAMKQNFVGLIDGTLSTWTPDREKKPEVLLEDGPGGGDELSLNDLTVSSRGLIYFTTLKDPEKGRLSVFDPATKKVTVLFDGEDELTLANPNGLALDRNERFLYVGISNYKDRKHSGIYAFPITGDGTIDLEAGKSRPRIPIKAPDGIVTDRAGNIYFTAGNMVHIYSPFAKELGKIKIPKGSGTNLCFGGPDRFHKTLFITTQNAIYAVEIPVGGG